MVTVLNKVWPTKARGATIQITTTFYDAFNNVANPASAQVNISFTRASGGVGTALIPMTQSAPGQPWTAQWDSRGAAAGTVYWSVETPGSPPVYVEDGQFTLEANLANQPTF